MGCFWSNDADTRERYQYQRRVINNAHETRRPDAADAPEPYQNQHRVINNTHEVRRPDVSRIKPLFGEYRCTCRRTWASRLSWPHMYQVCKRCGNKVYAHTQRALRPSDSSRENKGLKEHPQDNCQMCQQLGQYCGNIKNMR